METLIQFPSGELTGRSFTEVGKPAAIEMQKGCEMVRSNCILTARETSTEMMAQTVDEEMDNYDRAVGSATPTSRTQNPMAHRKPRRITDRNGHTILAFIEEDEEANRKICFCQQYIDGTFSRVLSMSQVDVLKMIMAGAEGDNPIDNRADKTQIKLGSRYANSFSGTRSDIMSIRGIVEMIAGELQNIPVYHDDLTEVERVEFYQRLIRIIKGMTSQMLNDHRAYYPLSMEDMEYITRNLGMKKVDFLKKLKKYRLLYLTPSSKGYQTNVRLNGAGEDSFTTWRYCILRDEALENDEDLECSYDF